MATESPLVTDQSNVYFKVGATFAAHATVKHSKDEYVSRLDPTVHTNTVEGFYSIFKRGMRGTYQHCSPKHLHRYVAEFDFRYSERAANGVDDTMRAENALMGVWEAVDVLVDSQRDRRRHPLTVIRIGLGGIQNANASLKGRDPTQIDIDLSS